MLENFGEKTFLFRYVKGRYSADSSAEYSVSADTNFCPISRSLLARIPNHYVAIKEWSVEIAAY